MLICWGDWHLAGQMKFWRAKTFLLVLITLTWFWQKLLACVIHFLVCWKRLKLRETTLDTCSFIHMHPAVLWRQSQKIWCRELFRLQECWRLKVLEIAESWGKNGTDVSTMPLYCVTCINWVTHRNHLSIVCLSSIIFLSLFLYCN